MQQQFEGFFFFGGGKKIRRLILRQKKNWSLEASGQWSRRDILVSLVIVSSKLTSSSRILYRYEYII